MFMAVSKQELSKDGKLGVCMLFAVQLLRKEILCHKLHRSKDGKLGVCMLFAMQLLRTS